MKRRDFIKQAAAVPLGSALAARKALGANDRVNMGLIGCGGRGQYVAGLMSQISNVEFVAVADVEVARIIQSGELGPVHFVRVWNYLNMSPDGIGRAPDSAPPAGLDWDFYLGPAPAVPFNKNRYAVTYRWFWDYAGGMTTDYGTHRFDTVHQVMGVDAPLAVAGWCR